MTASPGTPTRSVMLEWVVCDGQRRHVSEFAMLTPRMRPPVECPVCGGPVRPHLGRKVQHHAAHLTDAPCSARHPESALHINLKFHLARELERGMVMRVPITVRDRCIVGDKRRLPTGDDHRLREQERRETPCVNTRERVWLREWDEVHVEHRVAHDATVVIPDITLKHRGREVGAIEVLATHAVPADKADALATRGVPWLEIQADEALIAATSHWVAELPLPVYNQGPPSPWRCERHQERAESLMRVWLAEDLDEAERRRHRTVLYAARVVDLLYPDGKVYRQVYQIVIKYTDRSAAAVALLCNEDPVTTRAIVNGASREARRQAFSELLAEFERDTRRFVLKAGVILDSPMRWARGRTATSIVATSRKPYTRRDHPLKRTYPPRYRYVKSRRTWWLPEDMSAVTWDRPDDDSFGEHPQRQQSREAARRRQRSSDVHEDTSS